MNTARVADTRLWKVSPRSAQFIFHYISRPHGTFECKLELAMEGRRFFDLVRWGEAETTLNQYLRYEGKKITYLGNSTFVGGKHEYYPIPQQQIDLMGNDLLLQNPGY